MDPSHLSLSLSPSPLSLSLSIPLSHLSASLSSPSIYTPPPLPSLFPVPPLLSTHLLSLRVLGYRRIPPAVGRLVDVVTEIKDITTDHKLARTFFTSPGLFIIISLLPSFTLSLYHTHPISLSLTPLSLPTLSLYYMFHISVFSSGEYENRCCILFSGKAIFAELISFIFNLSLCQLLNCCLSCHLH